MKRAFINLMIISSTIAIILYIVGGFYRLMLIPYFFIVISTVGYLFKITFIPWLKEKTIQEQKELAVIKELNNRVYYREKVLDYELTIKPYYEYGKELFTNLMKNGIMRQFEIKDLKNLIDNRLGEYGKMYAKYKFANDANEIYVKMKNVFLNESDWCEIIAFLKNIQNNPIPKISNKKRKDDVK